MWYEEYEALGTQDKTEFRRIANQLLSRTYLTKYSFDTTREMTLANPDYSLSVRHFSLLEEYFWITGWRLERDDIYGYMSLINTFDNNRYRLDQFTTLFLYTCRMIYEEQRENASKFHTVLTSTFDITEKMASLGLLKKGKSTREQRLTAMRTLAHYNLIEKMESLAWEPDGNSIIILPSILAVITKQGVDAMNKELEELRLLPAEDTDERQAVSDNADDEEPETDGQLSGSDNYDEDELQQQPDNQEESI